MIKSRLRASLSPLFTCEHGVVRLKAKLISFNRSCAAQIFTSSQLKTVVCQKHVSHSGSDEEDDFSELGSPVGKGGGTMLELMTEKPEPFKKSVGSIKASSTSSLALESARKFKEFSKSSYCSSASDINHVNKISCNFDKSKSIVIKKVPSVIQLPQLQEAVSVFGKISNASMRAVPNGLDCCDIEFESVESRTRAVSAGRITVKNFDLLVLPLDAHKIVTIRISNINSQVADSAIHKICKSCGTLEWFVRRSEDAADALFSVEGKSDAELILEKLNDNSNGKWSAHLKTEDSTSMAVTNNDNAQWHLGLKVLEDLKSQIAVTQVYVEDLEYLHQAIMHLQNHPSTRSNLFNIN